MSTITIPTTIIAPGHTSDRFCNTPCDDCNDEMTRRAVRYQQAHRIGLRRMMEEAPGSQRGALLVEWALLLGIIVVVCLIAVGVGHRHAPTHQPTTPVVRTYTGTVECDGITHTITIDAANAAQALRDASCPQ